MNRVIRFFAVWVLAMVCVYGGREGVYNGVIGEGVVGAGGVAEQAAFDAGNGYLLVRGNSGGSFSGVLRLAGRSHGFSGSWSANGRASISVPREGRTGVVLELEHLAVGLGEVRGTVKVGALALPVSALRGDAWVGGATVHPLAGRKYGVLLPAPTGMAVGFGLWTITVGGDGMATVSGWMGNGARVAMLSWVVDRGEGKWVVPVYGSCEGVVAGELEIGKEEVASGSEVGGRVVWLKSGSVGLPKGGYLRELMAVGTLQTREGGEMRTGLGGGSFSLGFGISGGGFSSVMEETGTWGWDAKPEVGDAKLKGMGKGMRFDRGGSRVEGGFEWGSGAGKRRVEWRGMLLSRGVKLADGVEVRGGGYYGNGLASGAVVMRSNAGAVDRPVVVVAPVIVTQPVGGELPVEGGVELRVSAIGGGVLGYQWRRGGVALIGAVGASYVAQEAGSYSVVVSNVGGAVTSGEAVVSVVAPVIVTQPVGGTLGSGGSLTLSVVASGRAPMGYQWRKDGVVIGGASGASYVAKVAGSYSVVVSNAGGVVTSGVAVVKGGAVVVSGGMVLVKGGTLPSSSGLSGQVVGDFWIGKYEVTWGEWKVVRDWSVGKGYDLAGVGGGSGEDHPVRGVSWYDVLKWSNARSEKEGLGAVYWVDGGVYRSGEYGNESDRVEQRGGSGYRLPLEAEWEWAARGGVSSKGYVYSGSDDLNEVGWYNANSGGGTNPVGRKKGNELGLYDMSGNVWEWCWELWDGPWYRRLRGGSWSNLAGNAQVAIRDGNDDPASRSNDYGFRLARSSGQ